MTQQDRRYWLARKLFKEWAGTNDFFTTLLWNNLNTADRAYWLHQAEERLAKDEQTNDGSVWLGAVLACSGPDDSPAGARTDADAF